MDYEKVKAEIQEISSICSSVPEPFREKCFEILLKHLLSPGQVAPRDAPKDERSSVVSDSADSSASESRDAIPVPAAVKAFMRRTGITLADFEKILFMQDGELHFVAEPHTKTVSRGQVEWAMLLALRNAFQGKAFEVDPEDLRSMCQEKGYYDRTNFWKTFKSSKNKKLLNGELEPQGESRRLTADGQDELATVLRSLAS